MEANEIYTLADATDEYLALRGINKQKYYSSFLIAAKWAWKQLFKNTIYAVNSQWFTLKSGVPFNYVDMPINCVRFFSASIVTERNQIKNLFYSNYTNIIQMPTSSQKKCGCGTCDCGGLCEDVNSLTYTTKLLFTINGVDYYEKDWVKVCPNGDVIEYRIVPVKKYNSFTGDGGDYMNDYMNDYDIGGAPFSDYTIVYQDFQTKVCQLTVKPCGCPENTTENINLLNSYCGCYLPFNAYCKRKHEDVFLGEINNYGHKGTVKVSECGTKIYYIPDPSCANKPLPEFLLLNWQTSGENCSEVVQVPEYATDTLFAGIDFYSKRFNNAYNQTEKDDSKYAWRNSVNEMVAFLNPLSLEWLSTVADAPIKY